MKQSRMSLANASTEGLANPPKPCLPSESTSVRAKGRERPKDSGGEKESSAFTTTALTENARTLGNLADGQGNGRRERATVSSHPLSNSSIPVHNGRGLLVGRIVNGWLSKSVRSERHKLHKPQAWATDAAHLDQLEALGGLGVRLVDEAGKVWEATIGQFRRYGIRFNRGYGNQVALPLRYWNDPEDKPMRLEQKPVAVVTPCKQ